MSSPSTDDASTASLERTDFHVFHVNKSPAEVSWFDENDRTHSLNGDAFGADYVRFDFRHEPESNTALFKIMANVAYIGKPNKTNIYLYIYPERIRSLSVVDNHERTVDRLGTSAYTLEFILSTSPALVVPKGDSVLKGDASQSIFTALGALSKTTVFRVAFACRALSKDRLVALCEKASVSGTLKTAPEAGNISTLYGGWGGKIIEVTQPEIAAQTTDSPPSYGDLGACPQAHPSQVRKRRRAASDASTASEDKTTLEDICKRGFAELGRRFDCMEKSLSDLSSRLDRVERRVRENHPITDSIDHGHGLDHASCKTLDKRMDGVEERVTDVEQKLDAGLSDLAQDVENQLYDVRHECDDQISIRVDDEIGSMQCALEDFVKDELYNAADDVEESVMEKLRDALS